MEEQITNPPKKGIAINLIELTSHDDKPLDEHGNPVKDFKGNDHLTTWDMWPGWAIIYGSADFHYDNTTLAIGKESPFKPYKFSNTKPPWIRLNNGDILIHKIDVGERNEDYQWVLGYATMLSKYYLVKLDTLFQGQKAISNNPNVFSIPNEAKEFVIQYIRDWMIRKDLKMIDTNNEMPPHFKITNITKEHNYHIAYCPTQSDEDSLRSTFNGKKKANNDVWHFLIYDAEWPNFDTSTCMNAFVEKTEKKASKKKADKGLDHFQKNFDDIIGSN